MDTKIDERQLDLDLGTGDMSLSTTQGKLLAKALSMLDALPVRYYVLTDGGQYHQRGDLTVVQAPAKRRTKGKYPFGTMSAYIRPFMQDMAVGDVMKIPAGQFTAKELRNSAVPWGIRTWGKGTIISSIDDPQFLEVMRIA